MKVANNKPTFEAMRIVIFETSCRYFETHGVYPSSVFVSGDFAQLLIKTIQDGGAGAIYPGDTAGDGRLRIDGAIVRLNTSLRGLTVMCR